MPQDEQKEVLEQEDENIATANDSTAEQEVDQVEESQDKSAQVEESKEIQEETKPRPVHTVPVGKYNSERKRANELEAQMKERDEELERLRSQKEEPSIQDVNSVAEQYGLTDEAAKAVIGLMDERFKPYQDQLKATEISHHKQQAQVEFDEKVSGRIAEDFPGATQTFINQVKEAVTDLAFTKKYNTYELGDIYEVSKKGFSFQNKQSAEPSSGGVSGGIVDYGNVTEKDIEKMSFLEYKKYSDHMASKGSKWSDGN